LIDRIGLRDDFSEIENEKAPCGACFFLGAKKGRYFYKAYGVPNFSESE
jgi:hypothetical protein